MLVLITCLPAQAVTVVATLPALSMIADAIMKDVAQSVVLVDGKQSPHGMQLSPSQRHALSQADLVLWVGPEMENWLSKSLSQLNKPSLAITDLPNLSLLSSTAAQQDKGHHHSAWDMHVWLDPDVMLAFAAALRDELVLRDVLHAVQYQDNTAKLMQDIQQAKRDAQQILQPVRTLPLLVMHDAWRYFFRVFGLTQGALLQKGPDQFSGMVSLAGLERQLSSGVLRCVMREPQFEAKVLVWVKQLAPDIQEVLVDPLGYPRYEGGYPAWLLAQANAIATCATQR